MRKERSSALYDLMDALDSGEYDETEKGTEEYLLAQNKLWVITGEVTDFSGQIAALYWINVSLIGGQIFPIELFGLEFEVCEQGLAMLSLVPIWLYRGRQGHHSKAFQYACYAFYPVHMLILGLIQLSL